MSRPQGFTPATGEKKCRDLTKARADEYCERCGVHASVRGLTLHHRVKRSQGGPWTTQNCVMLCGHGTIGCHGWVEHNPDDAEKQGFHVRPWNDPAEIPILRRGLLALLDGAGDYTVQADDGGFERVPAPTQETA